MWRSPRYVGQLLWSLWLATVVASLFSSANGRYNYKSVTGYARVTGMPNCQNCGSFVTGAYARVFTPKGIDEPRVCPECTDKIRDGADVREARSPRNN